MAHKILHRRGLKANIPLLTESELGFCTDTREVYIGSSVGNIRVHGDYVTPEMYGAKGDGVHDDTAAIQAAINASSIGKPTIIKACLYRTTQPLVINTSFNSLKGMGIKSVIWGDHAGYVLDCGKPLPGAETIGITLKNFYLWSALGSGLNINNTNKSCFENVWAWSAGNGFTIQELSIINTFTNFYYSSNLYAAMRAMYPLLPAVVSAGMGISVIRPTVESNALTFVSPVIEGAGSHGISVTGTHVTMTFINPVSEGNTGYGYFFDGDTGQNRNLTLINPYAEANVAGSLYAKKQHSMIIDGGCLGTTAGHNVVLIAVSHSKFRSFDCRDLSEDITSDNNEFDDVRYATATRLGVVPSVLSFDCDKDIRSSGMTTNYTPKNGAISMAYEVGANTGNIAVYDDIGAAYKALSLFCLLFNLKNATGASKLTMDSTGRIGINDVAPNEQLDVGGNANVTGVYKVADVQVVGARGAAVADATDAASVILRLNELLARQRAHGLIAT